MPGYPALHGYRAGGGNAGGRPEPTHQPAPRFTVLYFCDREGCPHSPASVPFAERAVAPLALECRCGSVTRQEGAPKDARPFLEGYGSVNGGQASAKDHGIDPQSQVRKRRSAEAGARILAERMAEVREAGYAR